MGGTIFYGLIFDGTGELNLLDCPVEEASLNYYWLHKLQLPSGYLT